MDVNSFIFNTGESSEDLKKKHNPEGSLLRKCQLRMLDMLCYIDAVCKAQKIVYRIDGGNVLGAMRHGGFIPWDDDVDIVVGKKDFKKLCDYLRLHPHHQYVLQDPKTDPGYFMTGCAVLRDLKSEYIQDSYEHNSRKYRGMQIDIFCYENHVNDFLQNKIISRLYRWNCRFFIGRKPLIAKLMYALQAYIAVPLCKILGYPFSKSDLYAHSYGRRWKHIHKKYLLPYKPIRFEGMEFPGPADPEGYLKSCFGDYMKLPPQEQRNQHQAQYKIWD